MICHNCLEDKKIVGKINNQLLCADCHSRRITRKKRKPVQDEPTIQDLMKKWNRN